MEKKYEIIKLNAFCEPRGSLVAFQKDVNCPFDIKRCFYIFDTKKSDTLRGVHANKYSEFLLVVISGSCKVRIDTGFEKDEVLLNNPMEALYLNKMVWKEMFEFSHNAVLMVLSNQLYDEKEYIRDYKTFLDLVSVKK